MPVERRRFPPPWEVHEATESFCIRDAKGQALAYVYFEDEQGRRTAWGGSRATRHGGSPRISPGCRSS